MSSKGKSINTSINDRDNVMSNVKNFSKTKLHHVKPNIKNTLPTKEDIENEKGKK